MNEEKLLSQIKNECYNNAPDNFEKIKNNISELSDVDRADIIYANHRIRKSFAVYAAAAAAVVLPAVITVNMFNSSVTDNPDNNYEINIPVSSETVLQTAYVSSETEDTSFTEITDTTASTLTEAASESPEPSDTSETVFQNSKVYPYSENTEAETTAVPVMTETEEIIVSEYEFTEPETSKVSDQEYKAITSKTEYLPGYREKLFCVEYNPEHVTNRIQIYRGVEQDYAVESPEAYTVYVYDVIIYDYEYLDLSKGDYLLKDVKKYTLEEILESDEIVMTIDDIISTGIFLQVQEGTR